MGFGRSVSVFVGVIAGFAVGVLVGDAVVIIFGVIVVDVIAVIIWIVGVAVYAKMGAAIVNEAVGWKVWAGAGVVLTVGLRDTFCLQDEASKQNTNPREVTKKRDKREGM